MYQSQSFHTANYRGNQPGHDSYKRSDSQSPSAFSGTQNVSSQYRGIQRTFQPTGYVSSVYGQQQRSFAPTQSQFQSTNPQSYHTANYRGNQPGHDSYLRSDSSQPSQMGTTGAGFGTFGTTQSFTPSFTGAKSFTSGISSLGQQQQSQFVSPQSYHTANYRGNQPGHDSSWRSDSSQPSQMGTSGAGFGTSMGASSFRSSTIGSSSIGSSSIGSTSFGTSGLGMTSLGTSGFGSSALGTYGLGASSVSSSVSSQAVSPQSYHTANYRGNQPGHDSDLRSDSSQPSQSQLGATSFTNQSSQSGSF